MPQPTPLPQQIKVFIETLGRKPDTLRTYRFVLKRKFLPAVGKDALLTPDTFTKYIQSIKDYKITTVNTYLVPVVALYSFWESPHLGTLKKITNHMLNLKKKKTLVKFNRKAIEDFINWCVNLNGDIFALRDRAFVITLADTGLRIHEACKLKRGQIDWEERRAFIEGKGGKEAVIRFSKRSIDAIKRYLQKRDQMKGNMKRNSPTPLADEPVFASHNINSKNKINPVSKDGMSKAIKGTVDGKIVGRMIEAGIDRSSFRMHDFRHYFVTRIYETKGMEAANDAGRHDNFDTTKRYTHIADKKKQQDYEDVFDR
jgi:integrase